MTDIIPSFLPPTYVRRYVMRLQERAVPPPEPQAGLTVDAPSSSAEGEAPHMPERTAAPTAAAQLLTPRFWGAFEDRFPVSLHGKPPTRAQAAEAGFMDRSYYHYWRRLQYKLRVQYILEQSTGRTGQKPLASHVQRAIAKENAWTTNVPSVDSVQLAWVPCQEPSAAENDPVIIASVVQQKWEGLAIKSFEGKGKGVIATMEFKRNQVVCDYHGEVVSKQEGERRLETLTGEPSYLFFFKGKGGKPLCIDAQKFPCDCHPDQETYGRRMNHSHSKNNVRPQRVSLKFLDGPRECVLFFALRDIAVSEELLWDYGVRSSSFQGEGWDLSWLDD
ncbi:N-lysine methyltransferase SETD8-like [Sinocyclocheilus grahami]|uniref:N-lysine methyltransferase SETD8-like n=1 Tax=Sinocyclocheilus grahami TaxID=75366 RepID=UPI0007AD5257|nr:PREDICTED: N-lysine methyltransferase SETD8-like [Sinocyclocheilus grahami]